MKQNEISRLEKEVTLLHFNAAGRSMTMGEIVAILSDKAKYLILALLSVPFCQPISLPGLSTPFGIAILIVGGAIMIGCPVWLPKKINHKIIPASILEKITSKALWVMKKLRRWVYPRLKTICNASFYRIISGVVIIIAGFILALPLPIPFSNFITAWPIFLIALGHLEDDGLFILIGYALFSLTGLFFGEIILRVIAAL